MSAVGLGCMRWSTEPARDEARARAVLAAALEAGVELLDTADSYARDDRERGHNEQLIADVLRGSSRRVTVVTKGGLCRPDGAWVANGRARHLAAAARASRDRLGVDAIDLYLLHAVDPRTPLATSVRALAKLRDDGVVRAIGLSNINPTQLAEALALTQIDAVEIELSPWKLDAVRSGLVAQCEQRGIQVLAHRPLGGPAGVKRAARDPLLVELAARHATTSAGVMLAWLRSLSPAIVTLPGPTTIETAVAAIRAQQLALDDEARAQLAARFLSVGRGDTAPRSSDAEVVLIAGMPAAGKSTLAETYVARGYTRLNRDDRGGSLLDLARALDDALAGGATRVVLDNTYGTRASRAPVIEIARRHGAAVRCVVVDTPIGAAQAHAVQRLLDRHGGLLEPAQLRGEIGPGAQFRYRRACEPPAADEGFDATESFVPARRASGTRAGVVVELDGIVWRGKPQRPEQIELVDGAAAALAAWSATHVVAATVWRPGASAEAIAALAARLGALVGFAIDVRHCAHPAGPPVCWCRKPLPGLGLVLARAHDLDLARTLHVGNGPADRGFATRAGMRYHAIADGWPTP
ncbi:MAG TPA: aldo/keto reductase [Kofleriaceae bacterium]|nr:aldo/keto reductase [Kofleriaceae bacterium]